MDAFGRVRPALAVIVDGFLERGNCYDSAYVGTYAGQSLYLPPWTCLTAEAVPLTGDIQTQSVFTPFLPEDTVQLVWVTEATLEPDLLDTYRKSFGWTQMDEALSEMLWQPEDQANEPEHRAQQQQLSEEMSLARDSIALIHRTSTSSLLALRGAGASQAHIALDAALAPHQRLSTIPYPAAPLVPVPSKDVTRVRSILDGLKYNRSVARLVNVLSVAQMNLDIAWLTGEARGSELESRHSFHPDSTKAALWIKHRIEATGADCSLRPFSEGFAPNIICRYNGTEETDELVLFSAHYDSRGSFGSTRAPGGDDDGSGTTSILSIARAIGTTGIKFKKNVELCLFAGEEQGLVGSRAYAREMRKADADIVLMIQADMLAYHKPGEPPQLGLPATIGTPEVSQLVANISRLYSPELEVGITAACCSDHQSFHEQGFASTQVFERAGPIADPMYHNSGDLSQRIGYDFWQLRSIAKVQFATMLHAAGFEV